jgi:RNA polymerase sigma factor (sigma-70 family)
MTLEEQNELAVKNIRLPSAIARRMFQHFIRASNQILLEDLVAEGFLGLVLATRKYNPDRGPFNFYASKTIANSIIGHIYSNYHIVMTGSTVAAKMKIVIGKLKETGGNLTYDDMDDLCNELHMDQITLACMLAILDEKWSGIEGLENASNMDCSDFYLTPSSSKPVGMTTDMEFKFRELDLKYSMTYFLDLMGDCLTVIEKDTITRRLGIGIYSEPQSLATIADVYSRSPECIRNRCKTIVKKIKDALPEEMEEALYEVFVR